MNGLRDAEEKDTGADDHDAAHEPKDGAERAVFKRNLGNFEELAKKHPQETAAKEHCHDDQNRRNDDARHVADALERNVLRNVARKVHREHDPDNPARNGEHLAHDAAHDADDRREKKKSNDDPVDFGHVSE